MTAQLISEGDGRLWLVRPDGWRYLLQGVGPIEMTVACRYEAVELVVQIRDVKDSTLDSIRVLRDEFPDFRLLIESH